MINVGVVAIGRNEGERLRRCLSALVPLAVPVVYVDSGSNDGSVALAQLMGVSVVELDRTIPFTAARARNAGFQSLLQANPTLDFVQFIDGDCEVSDGWFQAAISCFEKTPDVAVVCGRRRERFPDASIYNRLIDIEWDTPIGEIQSCGGDSLMKVATFDSVGRFDESIAAGEEPEYCSRLRNAGYRIQRVDAEMTKHDAAITTISQWWRRHQRSGYGGLDVQQRFDLTMFDRELRSARVWTIGVLSLCLIVSFLSGLWLGFFGCIIGILVATGLWCFQTMRISRFYRQKGLSLGSSLRAGLVSMAVKWANLIGQMRYFRDRRHGKYSRLIEYKSDDNQSRTDRAITRETVSP